VQEIGLIYKYQATPKKKGDAVVVERANWFAQVRGATPKIDTL
jgi:hypothetical protein